MFFEVLGLAIDPIFFSPSFFPTFSLFVARSMRVIHPPLIYSPVSNPCPLRDDSLVGLSVIFSLGLRIRPPLFTAQFLILALCVMIPWLVYLLIFFSGFTDSLLELGDLFIVFLFPY
jgi:hypothetical protein